ncbi:MAG TPA: response regulator [Candidatus Saccharimonadales bacterium]|nr:response regulator [Candidatus Saccharimonadales bacterium]
MANIIIVEDDVNLANIYKKKLTEGGHKAEVVADVDAVKTISSKKPNLVLLDILMPKVNGLDVLRELKADPAAATIPVVMLTNVADDTSIAKGLELGAYGYLLKSETTPDQVLSRVNMTLDETAPAKP